MVTRWIQKDIHVPIQSQQKRVEFSGIIKRGYFHICAEMAHHFNIGYIFF